MSNASNPLILVIDDSVEDRFFLCRAIRKLMPSAQIEEFTYSEDALMFLGKSDQAGAAFLFVDINIPRMDGFEFVEAYLANQNDAGTLPKVIVMSNSIDPNDRLKAENHDGIHAFMSKPVTSQMLGDIL